MRGLALFALVILFPVFAASPEPPAEMRVTEAIVFKNGLAFVTRQGALSFREGAARVVPAPEALLGTLWVGAGERRIEGVRASREVVEVETDATSVAALYRYKVWVRE